MINLKVSPKKYLKSLLKNKPKKGYVSPLAKFTQLPEDEKIKIQDEAFKASIDRQMKIIEKANKSV